MEIDLKNNNFKIETNDSIRPKSTKVIGLLIEYFLYFASVSKRFRAIVFEFANMFQWPCLLQ